MLAARPPLPVVADAHRIPLFSQTGGPTQNLNGFRPLPPGWGLQWKFLLPGTFDAAGPNDAHLPQPSYKIDAELGHPLGTLPASVSSPEVLVPGVDPAVAQVLSVRNLLRGLRLRLPAGPDVARAMGINRSPTVSCSTGSNSPTGPARTLLSTPPYASTYSERRISKPAGRTSGRWEAASLRRS